MLAFTLVATLCFLPAFECAKATVCKYRIEPGKLNRNCMIQ